MTLEEYRKLFEEESEKDHSLAWGEINEILDDWQKERDARQEEAHQLREELAQRNVELADSEVKVMQLEKKPSITILSDGDGWHWLYVNNELKHEGHDAMEISALCEVLGFAYQYRDWDSGELGEFDPPEKLT